MSEGKYLIDGLEINPNPCAQTAFERGLVRGAKWAAKTILIILDDFKEQIKPVEDIDYDIDRWRELQNAQRNN